MSLATQSNSIPFRGLETSSSSALQEIQPCPVADDAEIYLMDTLPSTRRPFSQSKAMEHTEKEWDAAGPLICHYYMAKKHKLSDVKKIMSDKHSFHATVPMYKKRLAKWHIRKNVSRLSKSTERTKRISSIEGQLVSSHFINISIPLQISDGPSQQSFRSVIWSIRDWSHCRWKPSYAGVQRAEHQAEDGHYIGDWLWTISLSEPLLISGEGAYAGKAVRKGFRFLEEMLLSSDFVPIHDVLDLVSRLLEQGPLLNIFLDYFGNICRSTSSLISPLSNLLAQMQAMWKRGDLDNETLDILSRCADHCDSNIDEGYLEEWNYFIKSGIATELARQLDYTLTHPTFSDEVPQHYCQVSKNEYQNMFELYQSFAVISTHEKMGKSESASRLRAKAVERARVYLSDVPDTL